jgi:hypothetical protein
MGVLRKLPQKVGAVASPCGFSLSLSAARSGSHHVLGLVDDNPVEPVS